MTMLLTCPQPLDPDPICSDAQLQQMQNSSPRTPEMGRERKAHAITLLLPECRSQYKHHLSLNEQHATHHIPPSEGLWEQAAANTQSGGKVLQMGTQPLQSSRCQRSSAPGRIPPLLTLKMFLCTVIHYHISPKQKIYSDFLSKVVTDQSYLMAGNKFPILLRNVYFSELCRLMTES